MSELGKISGKLLNANLVRDGVDLTFRNAHSDPDFFYLNVTQNNIGINTDNPLYDLDVSGRLETDDLNIGSSLIIGNVSFNANSSISTTTGNLNLVPAQPDAYFNHDRLTTSVLSIDGNLISAILSNSNVNFDPSGTGIVNLLEPTNITGDLEVSDSITLTGNLQIGGTITIGDGTLDNIEVTSDFGKSIVPSENNSFDLGSPTYNWASVEVVNADVENLTQNSILIDSKLYLAPNGNDIRIIESNSPLEIRSDTGNIFLEALRFNANEIENLRNTPITLTSTGTGYFSINDSNGFVIPVGTTAERVGNEVGDTRWNSEIGWMECYDGTTWYVATGPGDFLSLQEMEDLGNLYSIILG